MYSEGSHGLHQASQGIQPPRPPPNQHHVPNAFPPPTHTQTPAAAQPVMHQGGFVARPAVPHQGAPLYAPRGGLPSTFRPPYVPIRQPVPIYGNMPVPGMYPNSQQNIGFASHGEIRNAHRGLSPMPPPPPAIPVGSSQRQPLPPRSALPPPLPPTLPLPPPPPHLQGPQIQLSTAAQSSVLPPPHPPPLPTSSPTSSPPSLPPLRPSSLSMLQLPMPHVSASRLHTEHGADLKSEITPAHEASCSESIRKVSDAQESRSRESNSKYELQGNSEYLFPAPPPPKQKEVVKRIEVLCQFIAKNGSNFEDMARKREKGNSEFEFLFGGEPGSDAAVAHDYFQWMKKKYLSAANSRDDGKFLTPRPLNISFTANSNHPLPPLASADLNADSDMEMEDDITPVDKVQGLKVMGDDLSEASDFIPDRNGGKWEPPSRPDVVQHPSVEELSTETLPHNEPQSLGDLERAACITSDEIYERCIKGDGLLRTVQGYASSDCSEDGLTALSPSPGSDISESEQDLRSRVLGENVDRAASLSIDKGLQKVSTGLPEARSKVERIALTSSAGRLRNEHSNRILSKGASRREATSHALVRKSEASGQTENKIRGPNSKDKGDEKSSAMKVDEFGRLVREGVSDSESDDTSYQGRPRRRVRSRSRSQSSSCSNSWSMSPTDKRRRHVPERRLHKRSRSRSWSPRIRRNRRRSPFLRRGNVRQDKFRIKVCFNFRRGKCNWGAACRYSHHDVELGRLRHQRRRPYSPEMSRSPDYRADGKAKDMSSGPLCKNEVENQSIRASLEVTRSSRNEKEMEHISPSQAYYSKIEGAVSRETLDKPEEEVIHRQDRESDQEYRELAIDGSNDQHTTAHDDNADNAHHLDKNFSGGLSPSVQSLSDPENNDLLPQLTDINHHSGPVPVNSPIAMQSVGTAGLPQPYSSNMTQSYSSYPPQSPLTGGALPYVLPGNQNLFPAPQSSSAGMVQPPPRLPPPQFNAVASAGPVPPGMHLGPNMANSSNFSSQPSMQQHPSHGQAYSHIGCFLPGPTSPLAQPYRGNFPSVVPQMQPYLQHQAPIPDSEYGRNFINPDAPKPSSSTQVPGLTEQTYGKFTNFVRHNPYASTFEQPLMSAFNSSSLGQVYPNANRYSNTLPSIGGSADGEGIQMSRQPAPLPNYPVAMHNSFAQSGVDQYDPLFDSINPSLNSVHKAGALQRNESAGDADARMSGSNDPFEAGESNRRKDFAPSTSIDDGFGETAEAEVGAVDNTSLSSPMDPAMRNEEDFEIDQVKSPGKSRKRRESRSVKLFKISIANFVKEVLRPSWRQGNMSKEAFKTIVKKTVDKVAGAMEGHRIPKSQAKIDQYIDSSQRKLTKLVMGYVDKYVEV
ncbi:hypothetical protein MLD38_039352 [Melastoma candidum]|uniref:Uncharacterized protein n=1 Tax=Melastoma candidum TaxID=119954 RepID=A0ACB9L3A3_9MYRT|nr:hypothetical protein MLD38_039352 [Melastoma candidum]